MSHNPNTVKSQHEMDNQGMRSSDVLLATIDELEKVKKERDSYYKALMQIQYKTPALGGDKADMETALCQIDNICDWALRPDEMRQMEKEFEELDNEIHRQDRV